MRAAGEACLAALLAACAASPLPEYARPTAAVLESHSAPGADLIEYRALARADFKAAQPPTQVADHRDQIGAYSCWSLRPEAGARVAIRPMEEDGYEARVANVRFRAVLNRDCSWWNPGSGQPEAYVLQHEQIHFALVELGARRLNARTAELLPNLRGTGATRAEATAAIQARVRELLEEQLEELLAEQTRFDEDTSFSRRPERQREWEQRVERELAGNAPRR